MSRFVSLIAQANAAKIPAPEMTGSTRGQIVITYLEYLKYKRLWRQCPKASIVIRAADWRSACGSGTVKLIILYGIGKVKDRN